tara:strand:- start:1796 stop:3646 length:1851 start_codon:yes stop_codon:yes gene_type:complete
LKQFTFGLSGHIDHGKTSIVKSLTGQNTDNLKDEIKRGLTIDIGFAHLNNHISIIDVPGHEKFIKNMVSGVNAIDCAILVIAADDGIMPQTKEHFNILKILKINSGIIIINKIDLVDSEWLELIISEIKTFVKNSFLENAKIIKVSTLLNIGIEDLKNEIIHLSNNPLSKFDRGIFRMFVDRVFLRKGFGTVVTGTVLSGKINDNSKLTLLPINEEVKIRSIQTHNEKVLEVEIGNRSAINIQNIEKNKVFRGSHLSLNKYFQNVDIAVAEIDILHEIKHNQRIRVHLGTQEVIARILFVKDNEKKIGLLKFEKKIVCSFLDRFIIRSFSPITTIGGGRIFDINISGKWSEKKIYMMNLFNKNKKSDIIHEIVNYRTKNIFNEMDLCHHLGLSKSVTNEIIKDDSNFCFFGENNPWITTKIRLKKIHSKIFNIINTYHIKNPYFNGIIFDQLNQKVLLPEPFLKFVLDDLLKEKSIKIFKDLYSIYDFQIKLEENDKVLKDKLYRIIDDYKFETPDFSFLMKELKIDEKKLKNFLNIEKNNNSIIILDGTLFFSYKNYLNLLDSLKVFYKTNYTMSVSDFKKIANTTRKYAVPLLEYLDKKNITYRDGNERKYNKK